MNSQNNLEEENIQMNPQTNQDKENIQVTINANNLNFYSDKQWEEYDILTKLDGYELDYQDDSSGWIKVIKREIISQGIIKGGEFLLTVDVIRIHKDGRIEHV